MPNGLSDIATAQATPGRLVTVPGQRIFSPVKHARFVITALASHVANDYFDLGKIMESGYQVIPEQCRIRHISGAAYSLTSKIQRVNAAGTSSDITATLAHAFNTAAASLGFAATANTEPAVLDNTDMLRLLFTVVTTAPAAGNQFVVEVAYRTIEA